mgnify:CR=1 FL=1|tara:strand:+ start:348 stop:560 length:213 start_codon:yes stop_codon:yes gene_type:complete
MNEIIFTSVQYMKSSISDENANIKAVTKQVNEEGNIVDTEIIVPLAEGNRHYDEIMRQVDAGTLTIEAAD